MKFNLETGNMKVSQVKLVTDESMLRVETDNEETEEAEKMNLTVILRRAMQTVKRRRKKSDSIQKNTL